MIVKDKVAIVTGASSGIGLAIANLLSSKGAEVALVSRSKEKLEKFQLRFRILSPFPLIWLRSLKSEEWSWSR